MKKSFWNTVKKMFCLMVISVLLLPALPRTAYAAYSAEALANATAVDIEVTYNQTEARAMFSLLNKFRTTASEAWFYTQSGEKQYVKNLNALTYDYRLEEIAMLRAAEAALRWDHLRPAGNYVFALLTDRGYTNCSVGENLAAGSANAANAFKLLSEESQGYAGQGHRRNMLSANYKAVGIGHAIVNGTHFWAQTFAGTNLSPNATPVMDAKTIVTIEGKQGYFANILLTGETSSVTLLAGSKTPVPVVNATFVDSGTWPKGKANIVPSVSWSSSNINVASVSDGNINGENGGNAALSGTMMDGKYDLAVTVTGTNPNANKAPDKARNFKARSSVYGVTMTWDQVPGADGYIIYYRVGNSGSFSYRYVITNPAKTNFTDLHAPTDKWSFYMIFPYRFNDQGSRLVNTRSDYIYGKKLQ